MRSKFAERLRPASRVRAARRLSFAVALLVLCAAAAGHAWFADYGGRDKTDDVEGWTMLARSYSVLGRFDEALAAHRHLIALRPDDAQVHADYADTLGVSNGRNLSGEPERLLAKALQLDPDNVKALVLAGKIAFDRGDPVLASHRWERALRHTDPSSEIARQLRAALEVAGHHSARPSTKR